MALPVEIEPLLSRAFRTNPIHLAAFGTDEPRVQAYAAKLFEPRSLELWAASRGPQGLTVCTRVHTFASVSFEWDPRKAASNLRKHGIDFADAATALHDPLAVTVLDDDPDEERFVTVGTDALGRILIVVFTWRSRGLRLISARRATARERRVYEESR